MDAMVSVFHIGEHGLGATYINNNYDQIESFISHVLQNGDNVSKEFLSLFADFNFDIENLAIKN